MSLFRRSNEDEELDNEIRSHLEMAAQDKRQGGASDGEARDSAIREFGNVSLVKEVTRSMRSSMWLEALAQDIRYGARMLFKAPLFSCIAILTLALGIGANTAIFSVVNAVVLNPLPYPEPDRIVSLFQKMGKFEKGSISFPNFLDWQRMNNSFSALAAYRQTGSNMVTNGESERFHGEMISAGFFEILGVKPLLGRTFTAAEDQRGGNPVLMITEALWRRKFAADPEIVGKVLIVDGVPRTVVGIVPSSFDLKIHNFQNYLANDLYTPIGQFADPGFWRRSAGWGTDAIGRLKPGMTFENAQADMARVQRELISAYPDVNSEKEITMLHLRDEMVGDVRPVLFVLLGAVGFVLLIACVNVANLLLARANARQREFAVRVALGAGRERIVRQVLTESLLLAIAGGALGLILAKWGTRAALTLVPQSLPRSEHVGLDAKVLLFTLLVSILSGVLFGLLPALRTAQSNIGGTLKETGRSVAGVRTKLQGTFVALEMALALVLLVGAGLMIRTLFHLWNSDPGFDATNLVTFSTVDDDFLKPATAGKVREFYRQLHEQLSSMPGITAASIDAGASPMQSDDESYFWIVGNPKPAHSSELPMAIQYVVEPDYLKTMGIQLKRGRFLTEQDNEHTPRVAVIDESFAAQHFPGRDPIGQYLDFDVTESGPDKAPVAQIVGIVAHVNQWGLGKDGPESLHPECYFSYWQTTDKELVSSARYNTVYLRTQKTGLPDMASVRERLSNLSRNVVVYDWYSMDRVVAESIAEKRFSMTLLTIFAGIALLLAAVGIYGVLSYLVGQRTQEIGVRMALGAQRSHVLLMVVGDGARMTMIGVAIGLAASIALTRLMSSMLVGVKPTDPVTFFGVALLLSAIAFLACYVPARKAMRVDPIVALRYE